jgi:hypothetical protein
MRRKMRVPALTEWLASPETQVFLACLRQRKAMVLGQFLTGQPVDPTTQGRAAAFHDLELLLTLPADKVQEIFDNVLKEVKK